MNTIIRTVCALSFVLGCSSAMAEGHAEKAGRKVDEAAHDTAAGTRHAAHKTRRAGHRAKNRVGDDMERAGDKLKND